MWVIDHFFYTSLYLPACSCFTDCPCSRDWGPYGTEVYGRFDCIADEVLLFLWRNLLEKEYYTGAANYKRFTRLSLNSKSVFRLFKQGRWHRLGFCLCSGTLPSQVGPEVALHILQTAPQRGDVYYDAKVPRWDAITKLPAVLTVCISIEQFN